MGDEIQALSVIALIADPDEPLTNLPEARGKSVSESPTQPAPQTGQPAGDQKDKGPRQFISPRARRLAEETGVPWRELTATGPQGAIIERDVREFLEQQQIGPSITPVARRIAEQAGLDWTGLTGSGEGGRITREDVERVLGAAGPAQQLPASREFNQAVAEIPVRGVRAVIAERMALSASNTAQVTLTAEADATDLVSLRRSLAGDGIQVSYNDLFLSILGRSLRDFPTLNASLGGDTIRVWQRMHVGLAVDTERGLLVPVIRDVDQKRLEQLASETKAMVERAKNGECSPQELQGGTFTLTNLGMYGIDAFTPHHQLTRMCDFGCGPDFETACDGG